LPTSLNVHLGHGTDPRSATGSYSGRRSSLAYTGCAPNKGHGKVRPGTSVILTIRAAR
jgi:hypothetical protein